MTIDDLIETFSLFDEWEDRYRHLIDLGDKLPAMNESLKTEETRIKGCLSQVWMVPQWDAEKRLHITADSDAKIVKGLIAVLLALFEGKTAQECQTVNVEKIFHDLGLEAHLSPNRRNGFYAMVERIRNVTSRYT